MARANKSGIDYFPFDVDFFQDEKIQFVSARFGTKGEAIIIRLLCKIYRNGYYSEFDDDIALLFAKGVGDGVQDSCVKDVVYELLKRGFFDKSIFERFGILTSKGIQNRYFEAVKRYKTVEVISEYLLVDVSKIINVNINSINVNINSINVNINSQKKREGEIKEKENLCISNEIHCQPKVDPPDSIDYEKFIDWFNSRTKGVFGVIKSPLSSKRKKMLRARISEHGKESFLELIKLALESDFLRGQNQRGWTATFDWLIKPSNYEKVLSGNYKKSVQNGNDKTNSRKPECTDEELMHAISNGVARAKYRKEQRRIEEERKRGM